PLHLRGSVCVLLFFLLLRVSRFLVTAPLSLRLDAVETVLLQLFGVTDEVTVHVFLKTSMAPDHVVLAREAVTLNAQNRHQGVARVRVRRTSRVPTHLVLHVQSADFNRHLSVPVSRSNGFLVVQTDKPLYTPRQSVRVRALSLNQELRPANRSVFLTFKDPDHVTVDTAEMLDINNGIPSLQNPFRIPVKPKLGVWSIEASFSQDFTTTARTTFEVKEYVLPSVSIRVEPESSYISSAHFTGFRFKVSPPLQPSEVLRCSPSGGVSQEAEFAAVRFLRSPYRLSLVSTPPFIKPGLPYHVQVSTPRPGTSWTPQTRDQLLTLLIRLFTAVPLRDRIRASSWKPAVFLDSRLHGVLWLFQFQTADSALPAAGQARLLLEAAAYHSPNRRYLYIDSPLPGAGLQVGRFANIKVYSATPSYLHVPALSFLVLSRGKVVDFGSLRVASHADNKHNLNFRVTEAMAPSVRLLVYYVLQGEGATELVADSVWLDVKDSCVSGLQVDETTRQHRQHRPGWQVRRHIELSDLGCGGGGGRDAADVFRLAGLTFITNANTQIQTSGVQIRTDRKDVRHLQTGLHGGLCGSTWNGSAGTWFRSNGPPSVSAPSLCSNGVCVSRPQTVSVQLPLSLDVPLPYRAVRGEQLELRGSVYNQQDHSVSVHRTSRTQ
uniref:Alpha-2-macroglobulin bait region domain-containing protein n=1 Tax=Salarias fasciatus TaxID=181472 RepID=A0A672HB26_SALFA